MIERPKHFSILNDLLNCTVNDISVEEFMLNVGLIKKVKYGFIWLEGTKEFVHDFNEFILLVTDDNGELKQDIHYISMEEFNTMIEANNILQSESVWTFQELGFLCTLLMIIDQSDGVENQNKDLKDMLIEMTKSLIIHEFSREKKNKFYLDVDYQDKLINNIQEYINLYFKSFKDFMSRPFRSLAIEYALLPEEKKVQIKYLISHLLKADKKINSEKYKKVKSFGIEISDFES
ncbi:hypothetical protein N9D55_01230 [Flavobacteriaceae bacterium]|nr:hypothetical protein [Flavobacteriaceae bacterium]